MSDKWKRILGTGLTIVTIIALVFAALSAIRGHFPIFTTPRGYSMEPTLHHNDLVLCIPYQVAGRVHQVSQGDIIVFRAPAIPSVWCHRVVSIEDGKYVTQGDNSRYPDSFLTAESDILGIVPAIGGQPLSLPYLGGALTYIDYNFALRIGLLAACMVGLVIMEVRRRKIRRLVIKRPSRLKVPAILAAVGIGIFALMFLPSLPKSGYTAVGYQVAGGPGIASGRYAPIDFGIMEIGTSQSQEMSFKNQGLIPAVAVLHILNDDFNEVSASPSTLVLRGKSEQKIDITVDATEVHPTKPVRMSITTVPYLMPIGFISDLAGKNPWLPALVMAAVPALVVPSVLYPLLPRIRRRLAVRKRKKPGFPIPKAVFIAPLVFLAALVGGQYYTYAEISMPVALAITVADIESASFGCYQHQEVSIEAEKTTPAESFICCNNLPANAKLEITSTHSLVQSFACCPTIVGGHCHEFNVVYDATGFAPDTYDVPFHVVAETDGLSVSFDFTVTVTVVEGG